MCFFKVLNAFSTSIEMTTCFYWGGGMTPINFWTAPFIPDKTALEMTIQSFQYAAGFCLLAFHWRFYIFLMDFGLQMSFLIASFSSVQSLSHIWLFATPWTAAHQASLAITNSWSLLKLMSIELMMPSNHLILCHPLLLLPSIFPSIRVFPMFQWTFRIDLL